MMPRTVTALAAIATICLLGIPGGYDASPAEAQACYGDCNHDGSVAINEVVVCVNVALGNAALDACPPCDANGNDAVDITDLIKSVGLISGFHLVSEGQCLHPCPAPCDDERVDANGLIPCGTATVEVTSCDDETGTCSRNATQVMTSADGTFSVDLCFTATGPVQFQVDPPGYRVIDIGSPRPNPPTGGRAADLGALSVTISPISEAAARVLAGNGLGKFDETGITEVNGAVSTALSNTSFAGLDDTRAATLATETAQAQPGVQAAVASNLAIVLRVGTATGSAGGTAVFGVTLSTGGAAVAGTQNDLFFDPKTPVRAVAGAPDCRANPAIDKKASAFSFLPIGCTPGSTCTGIRAAVLDLGNTDPIPKGAQLYSCTIAIAVDASGTYPLSCSGSGASPPEGGDIDAQCTAGAVMVTQ